MIELVVVHRWHLVPERFSVSDRKYCPYGGMKCSQGIGVLRSSSIR